MVVSKLYYLEKKLERILSFLFGMFLLLTGLGGAVLICVKVLTGVFLIEYLLMFMAGFFSVFITVVGLMLLVMFLGDKT